MLSGEKKIPIALWIYQNQKNWGSVKPPARTLRSTLQLRGMSSPPQEQNTPLYMIPILLWAVCVALDIRNNSMVPLQLTIKWLTFTFFVLPDIAAVHFCFYNMTACAFTCCLLKYHWAHLLIKLLVSRHWSSVAFSTTVSDSTWLTALQLSASVGMLQYFFIKAEMRAT